MIVLCLPTADSPLFYGNLHGIPLREPVQAYQSNERAQALRDSHEKRAASLTL
jgi:hypothetical protein